MLGDALGKALGAALSDALADALGDALGTALGDALGERDLPRLLKRLDEDLWAVKTDRKKSVIGLVGGLVSKVRSLLFARELMDGGWLKPARSFRTTCSHWAASSPTVVRSSVSSDSPTARSWEISAVPGSSVPSTSAWL